MIDQGFLPDSKTIFQACPKDLQLGLFSATVSAQVQSLINDLFANAEFFRSSGSGKVVQSLTTQNRIVKDGLRWPVLEKILNQPIEGGTILFTNTREQCDKLAKLLADNGYEAVIYRGEMEPNERRTNLKRFSSGKVKLLVATDIAGRGLDIINIDRVINYHLPRQKENYLHRAGRTARAGRKGLVINLVTERDEFLLARLEGKERPPGRNREKYSSKTDAAQSKVGISPRASSTSKPSSKKESVATSKKRGSMDAKPNLKKDSRSKPPFMKTNKPTKSWASSSKR
jgi:superfamily II DNA/RNA helicase